MGLSKVDRLLSVLERLFLWNEAHLWWTLDVSRQLEWDGSSMAKCMGYKNPLIVHVMPRSKCTSPYRLYFFLTPNLPYLHHKPRFDLTWICDCAHQRLGFFLAQTKKYGIPPLMQSVAIGPWISRFNWLDIEFNAVCSQGGAAVSVKLYCLASAIKR